MYGAQSFQVSLLPDVFPMCVVVEATADAGAEPDQEEKQSSIKKSKKKKRKSGEVVFYLLYNGFPL
jgi:hypothetical protein